VCCVEARSEGKVPIDRELCRCAISYSVVSAIHFRSCQDSFRRAVSRIGEKRTHHRRHHFNRSCYQNSCNESEGKRREEGRKTAQKCDRTNRRMYTYPSMQVLIHVVDNALVSLERQSAATRIAASSR
jgi:hypothetical protein